MNSDTGMVTIREHLYLTEDKSRVVKEGDPAGRWLWAAPGELVARADALRLGAWVPAVQPAAPKQLVPPADKAQARPADKGR